MKENMKEETEQMNNLIASYLSGEIDHEGRRQLEEWVARSEEHQRHFEETRNIWQLLHPAFDVEPGSATKALKDVWGKMETKERFTLRLYRKWSRVASILLLPLLGILIYMFTLLDPLPYQEIACQEVTAPYGTKVNVRLPDGSYVCLNSGGKIKYPVEFKAGERNVYLDGEAYFEVHSDKKNPFVVHTRMLDVRATGTAFNVEGYASDTIGAVTMVKGIIEVVLNQKQESLNLQPGQRMGYNTQSLRYQVEEVDTYKWCAWKDGKLIFRDEPLKDVFRKIGHIYNTDIVVKDEELARHLYRATFQKESLNEILRLMKLTIPMTYVEKNSTVGPDGTFSRRYIEVTRSK